MKTDLLVGEPLVLAISIDAGGHDLLLDPDLGRGDSALRILIDRGQGFVRFRQRTLGSTWYEDGKQSVPGGKTSFEFTVGYDANIGTFAFPAAGTHRLLVEYGDDSIKAVRSDPITLQVRMPEGDERTVHEAIRQKYSQAVGVNEPVRTGGLTELIQRFPTSVYLHELRILDLGARYADILSGFEPDGLRVAGNPGAPPPPPDTRPATIKQRIATLLPEATDLAEVQGQFQPDALLLAANLQTLLGNEEQAQHLYRRLIQEFPGRDAASRAAQEVQSDAPPTLSLAPSPATLWPPNHRLVAIAVNVSAQSEHDPNPIVRLESITCDDGCDPAQDIVDADFGVDDREFLLRATRRGAGSGRTYTITYSASDAAGNKATTQTLVKVAHDQGGGGGGSTSAWRTGVNYKTGDLATHDGFTWKCIQAHRSQSDWAPPRVPALWVKISKGKEWDHRVQYAVGAEVTYQGATYTCRQAHTSQVGWAPPNTPALWSLK